MPSEDEVGGTKAVVEAGQTAGQGLASCRALHGEHGIPGKDQPDLTAQEIELSPSTAAAGASDVLVTPAAIEDCHGEVLCAEEPGEQLGQAEVLAVRDEADADQSGQRETGERTGDEGRSGERPPLPKRHGERQRRQATESDSTARTRRQNQDAANNGYRNHDGRPTAG